MAAKIISSGFRYTTLPEGYVRPVNDGPNLSQVSDCKDVPVIDIGCGDRQLISRQIGDACRNYGFFQVVNHGVPNEIVEKMQQIGREFFELPVEEKMKIYSEDPTKTMRLSTSFNTQKEKVHNWRDFLRLHCYPLDQYTHEWPSNPSPPISVTRNCLTFSQSNSAATFPSVPRSPGSRWKKGKLLGRGSFGHVYVGFNSESGEMCAMKEVTLVSDDAKSRESAKQLAQEVSLLSRLSHPNIVQYIGSEMVDDKLYVYLEYVSGGSIDKLLQDYGQLGELAIRSYTQQILSGLAYLHSKNTIHRDIKGANILVDPNGRVKVADFGMAKHITGQACPLSFKGSPYWMAPEIIKNTTGSNLAVDIWSLGCTVLEMATTKPPWSQYEGVAALFKIGNSKELPAIPDHLSDEGKDFVRQCLQRNPMHRPTAAQLLDHSFVRNVAPLERPIQLGVTIDPEPASTGPEPDRTGPEI